MPCFQARPSSPYQNDITTGVTTDVAFGTEVFDQGGHFSGSTFTAPVDGKYQINFHLYLTGIDDGAQYIQIMIKTSNRQYEFWWDPDGFDSDPAKWTFSGGHVCDMEASDTAKIQIRIQDGGATTDVHGDSTFSGYMVA